MGVSLPETTAIYKAITVAVHDTTVVRDTVFQYLGRMPLPVPIKVDDGITFKDVLSWAVPSAVAVLAALFGAWLRKLPRQVDSPKEYSRSEVGLGRNVSGGTRPRLSWGRFVLKSAIHSSVTALTSSSDPKV